MRELAKAIYLQAFYQKRAQFGWTRIKVAEHPKTWQGWHFSLWRAHSRMARVAN